MEFKEVLENIGTKGTDNPAVNRTSMRKSMSRREPHHDEFHKKSIDCGEGNVGCKCLSTSFPYPILYRYSADWPSPRTQGSSLANWEHYRLG